MNIIAMGGGGFSQEPDNPRLDRYILNQSAQISPKICFIPTASGDSEDYIQRFYEFFEKENCEPTHLSLLQQTIADKEAFLLSQDIIYVGGGNTRNLIALWKEWGLDKILRKALQQEIILAGISAGAICWFEEGLSDSVPGEWSNVPALGYLHGSLCPHYDGESQRQFHYRSSIETGSMKPGYALDDGAALHFVGDTIHAAIASRPEATAYSVTVDNNKVIEKPYDMNYLSID
ncbi:peptidase E [Pontibacillus yanchengensis]|uniref:Peptidase E n=2 Tax=Pontibacillus yanchengensis TaxID=462910 RepID=A0ACC7VC62_9BACI|nr:peptidase E [Pontibacillus yanchengensis]MYL32412.1 peptidase E [Pontibacillus yanchengensis]MYL52993.1 peptidase E [Pontibacillus yanchengensis]